MFTVKIHNPASNHHGLTCGHSHKTEESAMDCRMKFTEKLRMGWTDVVVEEIIKNPAAVALGSVKSDKKSKSSAANGKLGGRPRKTPAPE